MSITYLQTELLLEVLADLKRKNMKKKTHEELIIDLQSIGSSPDLQR